MGATLVSTIPLPAPTTETTNVVATESKGLAKSEPKTPEKEPDAIPIPDKSVKTKPKPVTTATQRKAEEEPPESNEVPRFGPILAELTAAPLEWVEDASHFMHVDAVERFLPPTLKFLGVA